MIFKKLQFLDLLNEQRDYHISCTDWECRKATLEYTSSQTYSEHPLSSSQTGFLYPQQCPSGLARMKLSGAVSGYRTTEKNAPG